jgi:DNA mismatch endonuclease (patch repair protein)
LDTFSKEKRSEIMRQVRSTDTFPERIIRSLLHGMGFRFRLHRNDLPGKPDLVLPKYRSVVFVHGCFWHRHPGCPRASTPAENRKYWLPKFDRTVKRDQQTEAELRGRGWNVIIVWECELKEMEALKHRLNSAITRKQSIYHAQDVPLPLAAEKQAAYNPTPKTKRNTKPKRV